MIKLRLSTKFLLSMLAISAGLTAASLLFVQRTLESHIRAEIFSDLRNSVSSFQNVQREREVSWSRSAELMADLPIVRAMMMAPDPATIQDSSQRVWQLGGSDLFVMLNRSQRVVALHSASKGLNLDSAQQFFLQALADDAPNHWWFGGGHLYEVFVRPVYFGSRAENRLQGYLAVGYEINDQVARQTAHVAGSQVAFWFGNTVARSTLPQAQANELLQEFPRHVSPSGEGVQELQLGDERFLSASVDLSPGLTPPVRLSVLKSYDQATAFLNQLDRSLLGLGMVAVLVGSLLVFLLSHTFTRPLSALVSGVRALEKGDFDYPLQARGQDEVAEVTTAFRRMRETLQNTQRRLLESERLATIGRMASSISHDLRHSLATVVANAEFLAETPLDAHQREELYREVRLAVDQMTEMLESFLEFSRTRETLRPSYGNLPDALGRALQNVRANPEFSHITLTVSCDRDCEGWFDLRRLERAFQNLVINAFEAVSPEHGKIDVSLRKLDGNIAFRVRDNGPGIPHDIRAQLFEPFVSSGKEYGTGLGLTVVQKIVEDHGGSVRVESTSAQGTVFLMLLPLTLRPKTETSSKEAVERGAPVIHSES
ncbi:MAG TPA: HAMP domain-containing sensor histidine kinase [Terriglobales bacterium]|nr:HAMP domain-containing sensor histidine kinase [Terriglobales bacterium]